MTQAFQLNCGFLTTGAAGAGAATPMAGDSFNVPSFDPNNPAWLEQVWYEGASTDYVSITSPRLHDNNKGITLYDLTGRQKSLLPYNANQNIYPVDTPVYTMHNTAAATGAVASIYSFSNYPGVSPRLDTWQNIQPRINNISGVQVNVGAVPAIGQYSAGVAINSAFDNFQANADYALLGYLVASTVLALAVTGQDTGNLKVGGPGINDPLVTSEWFKNLSVFTGRPFIPIIAANNKGSTLVAQTDNSAAAAQSVTLILAELS
jgi:hypothetical protein